jgi:hypothetical protein
MRLLGKDSKDGLMKTRAHSSSLKVAWDLFSIQGLERTSVQQTEQST